MKDTPLEIVEGGEEEENVGNEFKTTPREMAAGELEDAIDQWVNHNLTHGEFVRRVEEITDEADDIERMEGDPYYDEPAYDQH